GAIHLSIMDSDPPNGPGASQRVQLELIFRINIAIRMVRVHRDEFYWLATDPNLQGLQFAPSREVRDIIGKETIDKGVRVFRRFGAGGIIGVYVHTGAANIFDDEQIPIAIRVNTFVATLSENAVERPDPRWPVESDLDNSAAAASLLSKDERPGKGIPGRPINRVEVGFAVTTHRCKQGNAVKRVGHIQVDTRNVSQVARIFVPLKNEPASIVIAFSRPARIMIEHQVGVFIRLGFGGFNGLRRKIIQVSERGNHARRIFEWITALGDKRKRKSRDDYVWLGNHVNTLVGSGNPDEWK